jgi:3-oxoacyl-[acyl-carrier-protein] synthase II
MQDVVVTGIGLVAGRFTSPETLFAHIGQGGSLIREHPFHAEYGFPNPASAFLDAAAWGSAEHAAPKPPEGLSPVARLAWGTAGQACVLGHRRAGPG